MQRTETSCQTYCLAVLTGFADLSSCACTDLDSGVRGGKSKCPRYAGAFTPKPELIPVSDMELLLDILCYDFPVEKVYNPVRIIRIVG